MSNYVKITKYIQETVFDKLDNINIHPSIQTNDNRKKRGLINGIGTVFKTITGNLDASDSERYEKILNHLKENQRNLQTQLKYQYSVNNDIIDKFKNTIRDIQHNEKVLESKINQFNNILQSDTTQLNILIAKDLYNQLIILYNAILNILQDIENSITFCKLHKLHPSIIKSLDLFKAIQKMGNNYKDQFPYEIKQENIADFENMGCMF